MRAWLKILIGGNRDSARFVALGSSRPSRATGVLLLMTVAATCQPTSEQTDSTGEPPGPEALVGQWVDMWNSYDLDQVRELFLDDERLTYFSSEREGIIRGMDALLDHHRGFGFLPGGDERPSRLWVGGLEADLLGDVAVLTGIWYFQSSSEAEGDPQRGPVTFVCVRDGGRWRFTHMNFSEYLPPESS